MPVDGPMTSAPDLRTTSTLPVIQNIPLVGIDELPDRQRSIFPFPFFNAVQSKCFHAVYQTDDNFVLSSPTGSGKTAILELAVCRYVAAHGGQRDFKLIYLAPTKSLCAERHKDWASKFAGFGLSCLELTGDTEKLRQTELQRADIIITTPEKWDSMTRKWRDHKKLVEMVRLVMIDEVHILKEDRGASLEAIVSRMKAITSNVRFIALSATVPNSEDIAIWLGRSSRVPGMPAARGVFGEEFRPVQLRKQIIGLQGREMNEFAFDNFCSRKLPEIIVAHSTDRRPIMVFCMTRKIAEETALMLATWWTKSRTHSRIWDGPQKPLKLKDVRLNAAVLAGVAFHHAGLDSHDRMAIETGYLSGDINVICCTSTLAVGVNLPCHLVIIKNTVSWQGSGCVEYSDLEIMQMLGRAGRPQFDTSASAVILTRLEKVARYERMVSGTELLESRLHLNLAEHLNAEIGLGTITDASSARAWLHSTFLHVRIHKKPGHYKLDGHTSARKIDGYLQDVISTDIASLQEYSLVADGEIFKSTTYGDAMARYYVSFETMKIIQGLQSKARTSEILSAVAQASELKSIRFRSNEKQLYRDINASPSIKFPIHVDVSQGPHKLSLMIQAILGGVDIRDPQFKDHQQDFIRDTSILFQHAPRLVRCIIDCSLYRNDAVSARNALEFARSLGARLWEDSPLQLMQLPGIGPVGARKLIGANISSIELLEEAGPQKMEMILSKHPPFGVNLLRTMESFPKLRVSLRQTGKPEPRFEENSHYIGLNVTAEVGFLNDDAPQTWLTTPLSLTLLAETSDGQIAHFTRLSARLLSNGGANIRFSARLTSPQQIINCYVACDDLVGTMQSAVLKPGIPALHFQSAHLPQPKSQRGVLPASNTRESEDFEDGDLVDDDLEAVASFVTTPGLSQAKSSLLDKRQMSGQSIETEQMDNGKWTCLHKCKNKGPEAKCRHQCCKDGMEHKPKPHKPKPRVEKGQGKLSLNGAKVKGSERHGNPINDFFSSSKPFQQTQDTAGRTDDAALGKIVIDESGLGNLSSSPIHGDDFFESFEDFDCLPAVGEPSSFFTPPRVLSPLSSQGIFVSSEEKRRIDRVDMTSSVCDTANFEDGHQVDPTASKKQKTWHTEFMAVHDNAGTINRASLHKQTPPRAIVALEQLEGSKDSPVTPLPRTAASSSLTRRAFVPQALPHCWQQGQQTTLAFNATHCSPPGDFELSQYLKFDTADIDHQTQAENVHSSADDLVPPVGPPSTGFGTRAMSPRSTSMPVSQEVSVLGGALSSTHGQTAHATQPSFVQDHPEVIASGQLGQHTSKRMEDQSLYPLPPGYGNDVDKWLTDELGDIVEFID